MSEKNERENNFLNTSRSGKNENCAEVAGLLLLLLFLLKHAPIQYIKRETTRNRCVLY